MQVGLKKLKCGNCPYETFLSGDLKKHIRSQHEKIKDHVCEDCGYATSYKTALKVHRVCVHNMGEMAFKCNICPYGTSHSERLRQHINTAHLK